MYDELVNSFNLDINTIKTGEYVRTDSGYISVVLDVEKGSIKIKSDYREWIGLCCVKSHSQNLIDLVEVGDIVNGKEVIEIRKINEKIYLMTDYCPQDYIKTDIKTILTKESYRSNCYRVGGENE